MIKQTIKQIIIIALIILAIGWILYPPSIVKAPTTTTHITPIFMYEPIYDTPNTHRDYIPLPNSMLCPQWVEMAVDVGWEEKQLAQLDVIMHRESRCFPTVHYELDPNGGSYGLLQVNGYWCKPSTYWPDGYLQAFGILETCEDLYNPRINLISARLIWIYSNKENGDGWLPWQT